MQEERNPEQKFDYQKVGLKVGLEIHQQLDTGKLFCRCPSIIRADSPDVMIYRKLHAVAGESGEIDVAAVYEVSKEREFIYEGYSDTNCLLEYDESPPSEIEKEALKIVLQIAIFLNCKVLPITQIMRKTVIDGSNTSGFQRTILIAKDGFVETNYGRVGIQSICLEEDAARIIEQRKDSVIYRLDRLGIPLVEIATAPDIKNPVQAKEVALHIGEILRACKVKRGIGTIRQDVNMSIKGLKERARVEIKGVQEPQLIIKTINSEIERQLKLIEQEKEIKSEVRKANEDGTTSFLRPMPGASRMYPETDLPLLKISKQMIDEAKKTLPKLKAERKEELKKIGLNEEFVKLILAENKIDEFKEFLKIINEPNLVAKVILIFPKEIAKHKKISLSEIEEKLNKDILGLILENVGNKKITKEDIKKIMEEIIDGKSIKEALAKEKIENLEEQIFNIIKEKPGLSINAYMGLVMAKFKGKISGKEVMEILKKLMK